MHGIPIVILAALLSGPDPQWGEYWGVMRLIRYEQGLHDETLEVRDVYNMLFQAIFGVEHVLTDSARVSAYLDAELASVGSPHPDEPLLERISQEGNIVRVNLRPFKALNLSAPLLVECMFASAGDGGRDTLMLYRAWNEFSSMVRFGILRFPVEDLPPVDSLLASGPVPAHHSERYATRENPAYRVVRKDLFERMFGISG